MRNLMTASYTGAGHRALELLNREQFEEATNYVIFEMPQIVANNPLGEFIELTKWFDDLTPEQQEQVIEFYNARLLDDYGVVLTRCADYDGRVIGYRFEIAIT